MGEEKPAEWYTAVSTERWVHKYMPIYVLTMDMLKEETEPGERILEMGSGIGTMAKILFENGYRNYLGIDFSPHMIKRAKELVPNQLFMKCDLKDPMLKKMYTGCKYFICHEVLEHIEDDLKVLSYVPKGATIIFSLPTADAKAHVRRFKTVEGVYERYKEIIDIQTHRFVRKRRWHLCKGVIK